jgi:hypothetical protein
MCFVISGRKRTPFVTPKLVRVPFVFSENIRSEYPEPVGKDGLSGALGLLGHNFKLLVPV